MKNFFLTGLAPRQKAKLQEAGVAFCDFSIGDATGLVVEEDQFGRVLEVLSAEKTAETATTLDGIFAVTLRFNTPSPASVAETMVTIDAPNGYRRDYWKAFTAKMAGWAKTERICEAVVVHCFNGVPPSSIPDDGKLHLLLDCAAPQGEMDAPSGATFVLGYRVIGLNYSPGGCPNEDNLRQAQETIKCLLPKVLATGPEINALRARLATERRVKTRAAYVTECSGRFEKTVAGTRQAITTGEAEVKKLTEALVRRQRELNGSRRKLEQLEACKGGELEKYGREFDRLLDVPKVRDVQAGSGVVKVFTDTLFCTDPRSGKRHEIGAFRIEINTAGSNGGVSWFNLTRRVDGCNAGMQAPHVFPDGHACFGNTAETFAELIANYEFAAVAMVAVQFVESVNVDDAAGKYIHNWPLAA